MGPTTLTTDEVISRKRAGGRGGIREGVAQTTKYLANYKREGGSTSALMNNCLLPFSIAPWRSFFLRITPSHLNNKNAIRASLVEIHLILILYGRWFYERSDYVAKVIL